MSESREVVFKGGRRNGKTMDVPYKYDGLNVTASSFQYPDGVVLTYRATGEFEDAKEVFQLDA